MRKISSETGSLTLAPDDWIAGRTIPNLRDGLKLQAFLKKQRNNCRDRPESLAFLRPIVSSSGYAAQGRWKGYPRGDDGIKSGIKGGHASLAFRPRMAALFHLVVMAVSLAVNLLEWRYLG
jgi:hypothetical protein